MRLGREALRIVREIRIHFDQGVVATLHPPTESRHVGRTQTELAGPVQHMHARLARGDLIRDLAGAVGRPAPVKAEPAKTDAPKPETVASLQTPRQIAPSVVTAPPAAKASGPRRFLDTLLGKGPEAEPAFIAAPTPPGPEQVKELERALAAERAKQAAGEADSRDDIVREMKLPETTSGGATLWSLIGAGDENRIVFLQRLQRVLAEDGIEAWVSGREKTTYSIWRKMQRKNVGFEQLSDILGFRVVVATLTAACGSSSSNKSSNNSSSSPALPAAAISPRA